MVTKKYIPDARDIVWVDLDPTKGREQSKTRPALVMSPVAYNKKTGLALMCPITSVIKGYPFEVALNDKKVEGVVLADHIKSLDWTVRNVRFVSKASPKVIQKVSNKLSLLLWEK